MGNVHSLEQARMNRESESLVGGYVKLYRSIEDAAFSSKPEYMSSWIHILLLATHKPRSSMLGSSPVNLKAGQFISGRKALAERVGVSEKQMRTVLSFFEKEGMITKESSRQGTIFTVCNYSIFNEKRGQRRANEMGQQTGQQIGQAEASSGEALVEYKANNKASERANEGPTGRATTQEHNNLKPLVNSKELTYPELPKNNDQKIPHCPHKEILKLWAEIIPETPQHQPSSWTPERSGYKDLAKRWKAGFITQKSDGSGTLYSDKDSGLEWWAGFFRWMRKSDFLINDCKPFCLEWVVKPSNFNKAKEGNYHA